MHVWYVCRHKKTTQHSSTADGRSNYSHKYTSGHSTDDETHRTYMVSTHLHLLYLASALRPLSLLSVTNVTTDRCISMILYSGDEGADEVDGGYSIQTCMTRAHAH